MVLGQFSDICGSPYPQISENWPRTIRATVSTISANIRKLAKDHKGYGSAARDVSDLTYTFVCIYVNM
jgi:hypothetical protein